MTCFPPGLLIADADADVREVLAETFQLAGYRVTAAASAVTALNAAARQPPDLAVLDVGLPDLNGYEVARQLRQADGRVRVLFLSAPDTAPARVAALTAGGDDCVGKPFSLEEVVLRASAILRRPLRSGGHGPRRG